MVLRAEGRVIPNIEVVRPDGRSAQFALYTEADERLVRDNPGGGGPGSIDLQTIIAAKEALALDASDGKLDFKCNGLDIDRPSYTLFWTNNSARNMLLALAQGGRSLRFNGRDVQMTEAFKQFVTSQIGLELAPGGSVG